jgi:hypothetical protein
MKTIDDLSKKLASSDQRFATLWKSLKTVAKLLRTSEDDGKTWGEFIPLIPERLQNFVKDREDTDDDNYLESIENVESKVKDLDNFIADKLDIHLPLSDGKADS